ncbi:hypothetical protein VKT23_000495 [Stygiomarasmius scandens]|uniref:BTB domain-containing protein n=1 Tax=Marasmiellus scandens TaxID=2682957 RepID=A0ABR1K4N3_9AGAR
MEKGSSSEEFLGRLDSSGSSDERPLALDVDDDITATEFEGFLDLLYPSDIPPDLSSKTQEEWIAILKISTKWGFLQIRELAIQKLTPMNMTVFKRIELAREYSVAQWLRSGYFDLVKQLETLTMENVESIGYPSSIRIFRIREQMIKKYGSVDSSSFSGYSYTIPQFSTNHWNNAEIHKAIEEEFIGELVEADERDVVPERADNFDTSCPVTYDPPDSPEPEDANETLIISQKLEKAIQLVREISEIQRGDLGEKEKEELIKKLQRKGERYWGAYSAFNHPSSIDVSLLQPSRATDAIEERILYLLNPSAQNIRTLQVTLPKKAKGAALRNTLSIILTSRNLSSAYDRGNLRIMNIFLPGRL